MKVFFKDKLAYNHASNQKVIALLLDHPAAYTARIQKLICHTLNAQHIWNSRVIKKTATGDAWSLYECSELHELNSRYHASTLEIIERIAFDTIIEYTNSLGETYANTVADILYHIINHSTYHRGQVMQEIRTCGVSPVATDFIFYKRV